MSGQWTGYRAFTAEGARCALTTCLRCGAAVLIDPADADDPMTLHEQWHAALDTQFGVEVVS